MVSPRETLDIIRLALETGTNVPNDVSYLTHEADAESSDADVSLPMIQLQPITSARVNPNNTDQVGWVTDDAGNRTGRLYHSEYEITIQIDCWVAEDSTDSASATARELGEAVRTELYNYSSFGPENQLLYEDGSPVEEIWRLTIGDGEADDDLIQTPSIRRWRQDVEVWAYDTFTTESGEYISVANYPQSGDYNDSDGDLQIESN